MKHPFIISTVLLSGIQLMVGCSGPGHPAPVDRVSSKPPRRNALPPTKNSELREVDRALFDGLAAHKDQQVIEAIHLGADVNARDRYGNAPLFYAGMTGSVCAVKTLIEAGADLTARNLGGATALQAASEEGNAATVVFLLSHGADPKAADDFGYTPLHVAARNRDRSSPEIVQALLDSGADVNALTSKKGYTALDLAESRATWWVNDDKIKARIVSELLARGARRANTYHVE